jgi:hypothetical protein
MKGFCDSSGRAWSISLTIDSAKRVRNLIEVNLLDLTSGDPPLLTRLGTDILLLCDVIYALVKPQADAQNITDEMFGSLLGGEAIQAAQSAFYEELIGFFQSAGRTDMMKALTAQRMLIDKAMKKIGVKIDNLDLDKLLDLTLGESSTNSPDRVASTPPPSP